MPKSQQTCGRFVERLHGWWIRRRKNPRFGRPECPVRTEVMRTNTSNNSPPAHLMGTAAAVSSLATSRGDKIKHIVKQNLAVRAFEQIKTYVKDFAAVLQLTVGDRITEVLAPGIAQSQQANLFGSLAGKERPPPQVAQRSERQTARAHAADNAAAGKTEDPDLPGGFPSPSAG